MKIRLAGGVVASGLCAWAARPAGPVRLPDDPDGRPGEAVAVGPDDAAGEDVEHAAAPRLVEDVGPVLGPLVGLWPATGRRPLGTALDALDPALRDRFDQLPLLLDEPPLPKALRRLVKLPAIADAYAFDLMGRRTRRAIGLLTVQHDPAAARAVPRRMTEPLLCALTVAVTCAAPETELETVTAPRKVTVPGYPVSRLDDEDGPWRRALPAARELGADTARFWEEVAAHGLRVPASWLPPGGWTALWGRAHSRRR